MSSYWAYLKISVDVGLQLVMHCVNSGDWGASLVVWNVVTAVTANGSHIDG